MYNWRRRAFSVGLGAVGSVLLVIGLVLSYLAWKDLSLWVWCFANQFVQCPPGSAIPPLLHFSYDFARTALIAGVLLVILGLGAIVLAARKTEGVSDLMRSSLVWEAARKETSFTAFLRKCPGFNSPRARQSSSCKYSFSA